jgi:NADP-dependent 3-hydroxy acid dehydrogenase YdfG
MEIATKHFRLGASILMSEKWEEKFEELRCDIQNINNIVKAIVLDVTQNQNLTLATSRYLEEVAETVKALEDKWLRTASEQQ